MGECKYAVEGAAEQGRSSRCVVFIAPLYSNVQVQQQMLGQATAEQGRPLQSVAAPLGACVLLLRNCKPSLTHAAGFSAAAPGVSGSCQCMPCCTVRVPALKVRRTGYCTCQPFTAQCMPALHCTVTGCTEYSVCVCRHYRRFSPDVKSSTCSKCPWRFSSG